MVGHLEQCRLQFKSIEADAGEILANLTDIELAWQPGAAAWSIGECLDHLVVTGRQSLHHAAEAIEAGRNQQLWGREPFRYGILEKGFVRLMEPPVRIKVRAPRAYRPAARVPGKIAVAEFLQLQRDLRQSLDTAEGLDLAKIKVNNPVSRWMRLSLGQEYAFTAAHERRHLWQIQRIKSHPSFPRN